jgi:multiple sugar transport system ATP-binding protein
MVMSDGEIQQMAVPDEVYARPRNAFVAGFVGEPPINFFDCRVVAGKDGWQIEFEGRTLALPQRLHATAQEIGDGGLAAIRPHFLSIGGDSPLRVDGKVFITEELQDQNLIFVDVGDTRFTLVAHPSVTPKRGETVPVSIDPDHLLLFPRSQAGKVESIAA